MGVREGGYYVGGYSDRYWPKGNLYWMEIPQTINGAWLILCVEDIRMSTFVEFKYWDPTYHS